MAASQLFEFTLEVAEAKMQVGTGTGGRVAVALSSYSIGGDHKYCGVIQMAKERMKR